MSGAMAVEIHVASEQAELLLKRLMLSLSVIGLSAYMEGVDDFVKGRIRQRFAQEGDDVSGQWMPLKEATVAMRESAGYPGEHPINVRTGEMYNLLTSGPARVTATSAGATYTHPASMTALNRDKIMTAQAGSDSPPTLPRPVLGLNERDLAALLYMFGMHLNHFPAASAFGSVMG